MFDKVPDNLTTVMASQLSPNMTKFTRETFQHKRDGMVLEKNITKHLFTLLKRDLHIQCTIMINRLFCMKSQDQ